MVVRDICQISDEKEEISNFNFHATSEESDELDSSNNLGKSSQIPAAWWDHSGSDILIGMDLGMTKKICNIDVRFNDNAEIENGFSVTVSNGTESLNKVVNESTIGSLSNSWSTVISIAWPANSYNSRSQAFQIFMSMDDDDDPVVSEIKVKALPLTQTSRNSSATEQFHRQHNKTNS